jgi:hypothetical protein
VFILVTSSMAQSASNSLSLGERAGVRGRSLVRSGMMFAATPSAVLASGGAGEGRSFLLEHRQPIGMLIFFGLLVGLVIVPLVRCAARREKYLRTCSTTWRGMVLWALLAGVALPFLTDFLSNGQTSIDHLPAGLAAVAVTIVTGWIPAAVLTVIVKSIFEFVYCRRDKAATTPSDT